VAKVTLKNVYKRFDDFEAVINANLEIKDKEFVVLVGPSGCGKTTTLRMIAGLDSISEGEIYIGDSNVNDVHPKDRDIAMVFQNYALYPHMTVYENMAFGLKLRKHAKAEINERVERASSILGLDKLLKRKPKQLSGGQRQRVALGRSIVRDPKVFLMDEPLSNLDAKLRVQTRGQLKKLHERLRTTIIYVTHDQVEAMTLGDRIVVMNKGEIQQADLPINCYEKPENRFVAGFIGSPAMNFVKGNLVKKGDVISFESYDGMNINLPDSLNTELISYVDKPVVFGIRPEDIIVVEQGDKSSGFEVVVDFIEHLGSENYAHCLLDKQRLVTRYSPFLGINIRDKITIKMNLQKLHIFNAETLKTII